LQGMSTGAAEDELVKNALSDYAAEQFEVASYRSLIAAAEELGDQETVSACQENLREDEEMARWLEQQLPAVTQAFLRTKAES
jgi:ferritin-like metal-binding protein YciE